MFLNIFAGLPATIVLAGTSFVTTEPAATMELSPMVTPAKITQLPPIHTSFPILIGMAYPLLFLPFGSNRMTRRIYSNIRSYHTMITDSHISHI